MESLKGNLDERAFGSYYHSSPSISDMLKSVIAFSNTELVYGY